MKKSIFPVLFIATLVIMACSKSNNDGNSTDTPTPPEPADTLAYMVGGDFSITEKMLASGGTYSINGVEQNPWEIFSQNGYNYARLRLFNAPNFEGPVCQDIDYVIESALLAKEQGMKILLDFHYSDTWADPQHQHVPAAWSDLDLATLADSTYAFTLKSVEQMNAAGVCPDMVQIGNEITVGMMWPIGEIYKTTGEDWVGFTTLLKAGLESIETFNNANHNVLTMVHVDQGGKRDVVEYFYNKMASYGVEFDIIGLSFYPWWHGSFGNLREVLNFITIAYEQDVVIVETAYYSEGYYPEDYLSKPFEPTQQGQYDFLEELYNISLEYENVKGIFYWKPDGLEVAGSGVTYLGRSLFSPEGDANPAISVFVDEKKAQKK